MEDVLYRLYCETGGKGWPPFLAPAENSRDEWPQMNHDERGSVQNPAHGGPAHSNSRVKL
jgi:hypothetical protein